MQDQNTPTSTPMVDLLKLMSRLRDPTQGCPWDIKQTWQTILPHTLEEVYEVSDAVDRQDAIALRDELGDLLFQIVFMSQIAQEQGLFDFNAVARGVTEKMIRRHPHVFGDRGYMSVDELNAEWEQLKANASGKNRGVLEGIASTMPTLARAEKIVDRLERAGEADAQLANLDSGDVGDAILLLLRQAHADGINADESLRAALRRIGG